MNEDVLPQSAASGEKDMEKGNEVEVELFLLCKFFVVHPISEVQREWRVATAPIRRATIRTSIIVCT